MLKRDFPILNRSDRFVYLDTAATSQLPDVVIQSMNDLYRSSYAPVHRGIYASAEAISQRYEQVRSDVAHFIGAQPHEIAFTSGTTMSLNMVAHAWALHHIGRGDEIIVSALEHHANLLPWQWVCAQVGAVLRVIPVTLQGTLDMSAAADLFTSRTRLLAVTHVSNVLGTHVDVRTLAQWAHAVGARVVVDGAQAVPHQRVNMSELGCDFYAFSAHKMCGPGGVGVLYVRTDLHEQLKPYQRGGSMVYHADYHTASFMPMPRLLEAGTPHVAGVVGLGEAVSYMQGVDFQALQKHEAALCAQAIDFLSAYARVTILGPTDALRQNGHLVSFTIADVHAHDVAAYLSAKGVCVRAGHHCAQPLMNQFGLSAAVRMSFYGYTTQTDVAYALDVLKPILVI